MVLLLFKNFLWAAWWPYCTMLLAMEKAAQQAGRGFKPSPPRASAPPQDRGQDRQQESVMASDAFKPEIPEPLRELMKMRHRAGQAGLRGVHLDQREGVEVA